MILRRTIMSVYILISHRPSYIYGIILLWFIWSDDSLVGIQVGSIYPDLFGFIRLFLTSLTLYRIPPHHADRRTVVRRYESVSRCGDVKWWSDWLLSNMELGRSSIVSNIHVTPGNYDVTYFTWHDSQSNWYSSAWICFSSYVISVSHCMVDLKHDYSCIQKLRFSTIS